MGEDAWLTTLRNWISTTKSPAVAVCFPAHRSNLVCSMAAALGYRHYDFRSNCLSPLGWKARKLPLSALTMAIQDEMEEGQPIVVQNAEALLAFHAHQARGACLAEILSKPWPQRVVLPLTLYAGDLPPDAPNIFRLTAADLPEEARLLRLAGMR